MLYRRPGKFHRKGHIVAKIKAGADERTGFGLSFVGGPRSLSRTGQREKLASAPRVVDEGAPHRRGNCRGAGLADAPRLHAHMAAFEHYGDAVRPQRSL